MTMTHEPTHTHTQHWYFVRSKCIIIWYLVETNYCLCFSPRRTRTQFESKIEITPETRTSTTAEMCKGHQRNGEKFPVPKYVSGKQVSIGIALAFSCATKPSHATFAYQSRAKRWKRDGAAERMNGKKPNRIETSVLSIFLLVFILYSALFLRSPPFSASLCVCVCLRLSAIALCFAHTVSRMVFR